jgi:hypothetical protein
VAGVVQPGVVGVVVFIAAMMSAVTTVCPRFRLERRFAFADGAAETARHFGQNVVGLKAQSATAPLGQDLHRHMPVAEVVGGAGKEERRVGDDFNQFFRRGEDFDDGIAFFGQQSVAVVQVVAAFEEDAGIPPRGQSDFQAAAFAFVVDEGDGVGGWALGAAVEDQE